MIAALAVVLAGAAVFGVTQISAQTATPAPFETLVDKLVARFNLNKTDVQAVFAEHKTEMLAKHQVKFEERLNQAIAEEKITEAQKQLILNKHKELAEKKQSKMETFKNMTREERRVEMEKQRTELKNWAEQNGIDLSYLHFKFGMHGHGWLMK